jgi:hypothetical protein
MNIKLLFPILIVFAAGFVMLLLAAKKSKGQTGTYHRRKLMTDNEEEFFGRLVVALPDHYVFPQVAMSAMLQPTSTNGRTAHSDRLRIAQQRVDYVVCTKTCEIVAVVELDDKTHSQAKDQLRDSRLEQAGIRTVRFQSRNKPKGALIRKMVLGAAITEATTTPVELSRPTGQTAASNAGITGIAGTTKEDVTRSAPAMIANQD